MATVGVVGVGMLGAPVSAALVAAGHHVSVLDRNRGRAASVVGARAADGLSDVAAGADVILSCVDGPDAANAVAREAIDVVESGCVYVEMATMSLTALRAEWEAFAARGLDFVECPVSGRPPQLTALVGGDPAPARRALAVLEPVVAHTFPFAAIGDATVAKLVNQLLTYGNLVLAAQGAALAAAHDVDARRVVEALRTCAADSRSLAIVEQLLGDDAQQWGSVASIERDLELVGGLAADTDVRSAALDEVRALFRAAVDAGGGDQPFPRALDRYGRFGPQ